MTPLISTLLILFPRMPIAYALYAFGNLVPLRLSRQAIAGTLTLCAAMSIMLAVNLSGYRVSIATFVIEIILLLPMIYFICGGEHRQQIDPFACARLLGAGAMLLSIINMTRYGFPFRLPYIHYLPDMYGALFGLGGAKIVTIIGFLTLLIELSNPKKKNLWIGIAVLNFIVPNYLLGIACGLAALGLQLIRKPKHAILVAMLAIIVAPYAIYRLDNLNSTFQQTFGVPAKVYAYMNTPRVFMESPSTLLTGTGVGQYASTPALWASEYLISSHEIPDIPGFFMSYFHQQHLGTVLAIMQDDIWALSSSFSKPYTSLSTLAAELGIPLFIVMAVLFYRRLTRSPGPKILRNTTLAFCIFLFMLDNWHDSLWLAYLLFLVTAAARNIHLAEMQALALLSRAQQDTPTR